VAVVDFHATRSLQRQIGSPLAGVGNPSLVTKKRRVLDVVMQRMQIAEGATPRPLVYGIVGVMGGRAVGLLLTSCPSR